MNNQDRPQYRIVILISGRGSNMKRIVESFKDSTISVVAVISNTADAEGLKWAQQQGIPVHALPSKGYTNRQDYDQVLAQHINLYTPDLVVLAGFMRILSPSFVSTFYPNLINIHPSLLPSFTGLNTHRQALDAKVQFHGCTVHFVVPELDAGPIIAQAVCAVDADDDETRLANKVLALEHELYPQVIAWLAEGRVSLQNDQLIVHDLPWRGIHSL